MLTSVVSRSQSMNGGLDITVPPYLRRRQREARVRRSFDLAAYVEADPINEIDPTGMATFPPGPPPCGLGVQVANGACPEDPSVYVNGQRLPPLPRSNAATLYNALTTGTTNSRTNGGGRGKPTSQAATKPKPPAKPDRNRSACAAGIVGAATSMILTGPIEGPLLAYGGFAELAVGGLALAAGPTLVIGGIVVGVVTVVAVGTYYSDQKNSNVTANSLYKNFGVCG